ncbi:hypothetical protein LY28_03464 [Ruminiclostridium sufflavum DSM 19573]|uniref:Uncharacterized protein n=1 Tax=Ruminiclostridium sufflavum DSM 19573 TaxID=1121337 RepID=A0A318XII6_9FIRM|nr:hypothetical protein [Ruminiclostridium sufflavum]PYG84930.1 hypothetical protein LY28_03464 [Ruminiclostridium sufflavum DSM 19573]
MAGERRVPNYRKLHPAVSEEVIAVLRQSERKMHYQEYDLKTKKFAVIKINRKIFSYQAEKLSWNGWKKQKFSSGMKIPM